MGSQHKVKIWPKSCMVYSYVKSELSHQTNESWPKILYCTVKKTTVVSRGHCLTKGVIFGQKVLYVPEDYSCQDDTLTKGKKIVPKDLYCQEDYSCVKGPLFLQTGDNASQGL